jgi:hypothetical protein
VCENGDFPAALWAFCQMLLLSPRYKIVLQ